MKRFWCAKYGALRAAKALLQMTIDQIPIEERPTMSSISNRRRGASGKKKRFNGTFCSSLVAFCNAPPFPVKIGGVPVISEEQVRIRFCNQTAFDLAAKYCREWSDIVVVQDATFKTNHQNLVLHSFSLAGLVTYRGDIHMRAFPIEFLLAHREDNAAYHDIVSGIKVDLSHVLQIEEIEVSDKFKDAFMDGSAAARNAIETNLPHTKVHLDLQHEKETTVGIDPDLPVGTVAIISQSTSLIWPLPVQSGSQMWSFRHAGITLSNGWSLIQILL
jgi:hypothetical protein